jgi:hypothetical protein
MGRSLDGTYARLAALPLRVDGYELERLEQPVSSAFVRVTTVVRLRGGGHDGLGEDVTYSVANQDAFQQEPPVLPLSDAGTLDGLSELVGSARLFADEPEQDAYRDYRRWAFESAALDLALRQSGSSLAEAVASEARPVTYVVSMRLGEPPAVEPVLAWRSFYPTLGFKLDPTSSWTRELVEELRATGAVDSVDLKGAYRGTPVDQPPDPELYRLVVEGFPEAWIEDPALTPDTEPILAPHRDRITWDAPIHSVDDVLALPFPPRMLNVKPSRFGSVRRLLEFYGWCAENGVHTYGGGQFELGVGRRQIQHLASLFHPGEPNDVAPGGFNVGAPRPGLPPSPLAPPPDVPGFGGG